MREISRGFFQRAFFLGLLAATSLIGCSQKETQQVASSLQPVPSVCVRARVDRSTLTIGDKVRYELVCDRKEEVAVEFPDFGENLGGFAVRDFGREKPRSLGKGMVRDTEWYLLDTFVVGSYVIPPARFNYKEKDGSQRSLETGQIFLTVKSVSGDKAQEDIRDIRKPLVFPVNWKPFVVGGLLACMLLAVAGAALRSSKLRKKRALPPVPPSIVALQALRDLLASDLIPQGRIGEYYVRLSTIVRCYLESQFSLHAPERTTEEFLPECAKSGVLNVEQRSLLEDFLTHCDLVKFARYGPSSDEVGSAYGAAKRLVEETSRMEQEEDHGVS